VTVKDERPAIERQRRLKVGPEGHVLILDKYVPGLLVWVHNKLSNDASKAYRKWFGLRVTDWRVLAYLGVYETGTAAKICNLIGLDKAATSRSIAVLKKKRMLTTAQLKGRNIQLQITKHGRDKYEAILDLALRREEALLSGFSPSERDLLIELLHRLLSNLDLVRNTTPSDVPRSIATNILRLN
jgi:DNA-binding MarR family transcriptional regulator